MSRAYFTAPVLTAICLCAFGIASANDASDDREPLVKSASDFDAANKCALKHFPLMARLGPNYVLCLDTRVGVPKDLTVRTVESVLRGKL